MKIIFTKHALGKFKTHLAAGWKFSQIHIKETIKKPDFSNKDEERSVKFVIKRWDSEHDLRVIYKEEDGIITVITFYPTEKGRYIR